MKRKKTSKPRFNLERRSEPCLIYLSYSYKYDVNGKPVRLKFSTGKKVHSNFWLGDKAKETLKFPEYRDLNIFLIGLYHECIKIVSENPSIQEDDFKIKLERFCGFTKFQDVNIPTFTEYIDIFISKKTRDAKTIAKFISLKNKMTSYQEKVKFDDITESWFKGFTDYLLKTGVKSINTLSKYTDNLKQICADATTHLIDGKPLNSKYDFEKFSSRRVQTSKFYFDSTQLKTLAMVNTETETETIVLLYFLIMCYTGLRVSDVFKLSEDNFEGDVIRVFTFKGRNTKADNEVLIPVIPEMKTLAMKYNFKFPKPFAEKTHNELIKVLVKRAGLSKQVIKKSGDMAQSVQKVNLHNQITNHTGRYTFINIMLNEYGITPFELQKITGQSMRVLLAYERGDKAVNARKVLTKIVGLN